MAVHNADKYISHAIESLLGQIFTDFELIVIDDASTDESLKIVNTYQDQRIRIIRNLVQEGPAYSRNKGLEVAKGEYIAILDADDVAMPNRLQIQVDYLDKNPAVYLVGSGFDLIDETGEVIYRNQTHIDPLGVRWKLLFGNCFAHSTVMYRREAVEKCGGYDVSMTPAEDYDLYIRFAAKNSIALLTDVLVQWRRHQKSLSHVTPVETQETLWAPALTKSVYLQTNQAVSIDVARSLMREISVAAPNRQTLIQAYDIIIDCFDYYVSNIEMTASEQRVLIFLVLEELFRIAKLNPKSFGRAFFKAANLLLKNDLLAAFNIRIAHIVSRAVLPIAVTAYMGKLKRSIKGLLSAKDRKLRQEGVKGI
jgi:glycosyltransferase involved in cell wall biosynthesis